MEFLRKHKILLAFFSGAIADASASIDVPLGKALCWTVGTALLCLAMILDKSE